MRRLSYPARSQKSLFGNDANDEKILTLISGLPSDRTRTSGWQILNAFVFMVVAMAVNLVDLIIVGFCNLEKLT